MLFVSKFVDIFGFIVVVPRVAVSVFTNREFLAWSLSRLRFIGFVSNFMYKLSTLPRLLYMSSLGVFKLNTI
jgi:hypothetical protein